MACPQPTYFEPYASGGTSGKYTVGDRDVKDPAQGIYLNNCSLVAVLASLAWKKGIPALRNHTINKALTDPYTFKFYGNADRPEQKTNGTLPQDTNRKLLHGKSDTSVIEIWPAIWEKAYYQWLDNLTKVTDKPNYCIHTEWQSPVTLLYHLTGRIPFERTSNGSDTLDSATAFSEIVNWCDGCGIASHRTIKTPAVAWTYDPRAANPAGVVFSPTTIEAQHTYSLLGVVGKIDDQGKWTEKYIVLRNPCGSARGDPTAGSVSLYNTDVLWCNSTINFVYKNDGIFAIGADDFVKYFAGYAWMPLA